MMESYDASTNPIVDRILESFKLTPHQRQAAATRGQDIVVRAGAGSGKTRTLVARYISLLAEGHNPQRVTAITFTEKAAREMRSRVREALSDQISVAGSAEERQRWQALDAQMDSARIGTIHSLCAEILRSHPAEAGVDPRFEVLDEGLAATLRAQAVADTLDWLVGEPEFAPLLSGLNTRVVEILLAFLLDHRLEAQAAFEYTKDIQGTIRQALENNIRNQAVLQPVGGLQRLQASGSLAADAGDKLAEQIAELLVLWNKVTQALMEENLMEAARSLFTARRQTMGGSTGKKTSQAKAMLADLKNAYDQHLNPWLGGKGANDPPPDEAVESLLVQTMPLVKQAFEHLLQIYQTALRQRQALDFDDLEAGASQLLAMPDIRRQWQGEIVALLVDEFQDTNSRQRLIVDALCGETPGRLFVVGDARQSIYRFRRADVTVFRTLQEQIQSRGGLVVDLNLTYRAHAPLLQTTGDLLTVVMGDQPIPEQPYYVPYSALISDHDLPRPEMQAPHVELILGGGEDAESARPTAARALAQRLHEIHQTGEIPRWDDVTLLFRASSGFPTYEDAFENAGIPFVTVAGQGFYNRPEIRDVLNLLRALADPWDDLAMVGLLRSPAFGLSDAALYLLRWHTSVKQPYWAALQGDLSFLTEPDQSHAQRALGIIQELQPFVDRLPVAELLKRLVDSVDYRAILASAEAAASRLWRNLDKLLADAQASRLVNVSAFLEYLDTLRDVGAREGEAPAESEGAVRLMTIHKAKGLEFSLVILADAARQPRKTSQAAYLLPELGLTYKFNQNEAAPLLYRLAQFQDNQQAEAEEKRLLYVALTRAKEKLLVSGHCVQNRFGGWKADGWLGALAEAGGVELETVFHSDPPIEAITPGGHRLRVWALHPESPGALHIEPPATDEWPESAAPQLYRPLNQGASETGEKATIAPEPGEVLHPWRATGERLRPPAEVLGHLVHYAIQQWLFPTNATHLGNGAKTGLLETAALEAGLANPAQRHEALRLAESLLSRLQQHPLWQEIDQAEVRYHEVPYARLTANHQLDSGYIDLLYRYQDEWQIVDFKTDSLRNAIEREEAIGKYRPQMRRYAQAVLDLLHEPARVRLCFLDDEGKISLQEM